MKIILRNTATFIVVSILVAGLGAAADAPDPVAILRSADLSRGGWEAYEVQIKITNFKGSDSEEHLFEALIKGADKSLVRFMNPRDKGRRLLMLADDMWIFLPNTQRPVRITPLQRLIGNASNGDVARTNYAADYSPKLLGRETVGSDECYLLELAAARKGATYQKVQYWVGVRDGLPRKADYFLASGKKYKSATFDRYITVDGRRVLTLMTIVDATGIGEKTTMEYSGYEKRDLPDKLFAKTQMGL